MKKLISVILALTLCLCLSACGGNDDSSDSVYPQLDGKEIVKAAEFHYTLDSGCKETFNLIFFVTDAYNPDLGSAGIYMLDMDSGKLYDDTFLDWNIMSRDGEWNMDTRDTAMMVFFVSYDSNKDSSFIWADNESFTHYNEKAITKLHEQLRNGFRSAGEPSVPTEIAQTSVETVDIDTEFIYEQAKLLNIQIKSATRYQYTLEEGCCEELDLLFLQSTEHDGIELFPFDAPGLYMLDMDSGIWYDSSFMDPEAMVIGNTWNLSTKETALMVLFSAFDQNRTHLIIWSDAEIRTELDAAALEQINQRLLLEQLTATADAYPYSSIDEEPRQLSDEEIAALLHRPAGFVKSVISTVPDAIAYLDMRFPELWMGMPVQNGIEPNRRWLRSAVEILSDANSPAARSCMVNCVTYLLDDDYNISSLIAFWPDPDAINEDMPEKAINCIKTDSGYLFFDPVLRMRGDAISRMEDLLIEMSCSSVAEYVEHIRQHPVLSTVIKYIFENTGGVRMNFDRSFTHGYTITTDSPGIELVYYSVAPQEPGQHIKPENIERYRLSTMLGGVTLTAEEAYALVDAAPEVVQEKVKTAADVLIFMLAARIGDSQGCKCNPVDGHIWHWNMSAAEVMRNKLGNCGSCANLANYLLDGDYEEVGFMDHALYPNAGGSHVYTYILHEGKYYIVDYSWYIFSNYEPTQDYAPHVLNSLSEWPQRVSYVYGPVCLVMTYDTPGMQYPVIFGEDYQQEFGGVYYILPEGIEYTVLYEAPDGYQYYHIPFNTYAYDWNTFGVN